MEPKTQSFRPEINTCENKGIGGKRRENRETMGHIRGITYKKSAFKATCT